MLQMTHDKAGMIEVRTASDSGIIQYIGIHHTGPMACIRGSVSDRAVRVVLIALLGG